MFICKYLYLIIIATFTIKWIGKCANIAPHWHLTTHHQTATLEEAIKQYFEKKANVLHVRVHLRRPGPAKYVILHHLTDVLRNSTYLTFRITIGDKYLRSNKDFLHNLWYVDSYEALDDVLPYKKEHFGSSPGVYAIYLVQHKETDIIKDIRKILAKMFSLHIIDVIVITLNIQGEGFSVYSFEIFSEKHCRNVKPVVKQNADGPIILKGVEAKLLETIAEHLQFRIESYIAESCTTGDVYLNGTMTGPYYLLDNNEVDILMGYFFCTAQRVLFFEESFSYFSSAMVVIVKHHAPKPNLIWMLDPFKLNTWLALLTMTTAATILMYVARRRYHHGNWLDIIGSIFGEPRVVLTTNNLTRLCIALWYSSLVILSSVYQAKLFDSYNQPEPNVPRTLNDLQENNFTFLVRKHADMKNWLPDLKWPQRRVRFINSSEHNLVFEKLKDSTGNVATISTVAQIQYFEHKHELRNAFDQVPETVRLCEICAYFQHHSYLVKPFNNVILMIRSSGLISRWYGKDIAGASGMWNTQPKSTPKQLDMEKFTMVFFLFTCGQLLAFIVFVLEMISGKVKCQK
ncbi:uncharacterized protein LOC129242118 [Anastrepha obliqua]|uniref:uncharacterized protein LOC129242118 n=1 Tax=Anastrepha obliqua TaxID=95512 RepID=UPI00240903D1|nr:uncharacterized protein LOC129242118 [Anastrepha obliqua]